LRSSFKRNGQKVRHRRCAEMRGLSNGETADSCKRQTFVAMSHDVSRTLQRQVAVNGTLQRQHAKHLAASVAQHPTASVQSTLQRQCKAPCSVSAKHLAASVQSTLQRQYKAPCSVSTHHLVQGSPHFRAFRRRERRARETIGETRLVDLTAPLADDDRRDTVAD
jgi:hypothetical protein